MQCISWLEEKHLKNVDVIHRDGDLDFNNHLKNGKIETSTSHNDVFTVQNYFDNFTKKIERKKWKNWLFSF